MYFAFGMPGVISRTRIIGPVGRSRIMFEKAVLALLVNFLLAAVSLADAQPSGKVPRVGFLSGSATPASPAMSERAFRQGLKELGYVEDKSIIFEVRYAEAKRDRIPRLSAELVQRKVDLLATGNLTAIRAAKEATKTIPIVMVTNADPVATKLIDSLARPGGNITGLTNLNRDLSAKRLEILQEILPNLSRIAILWDPTNEGSAIGFKEYEEAAEPMKIHVQSLEVRGPNTNLETLIQTAVEGRANALIPIRSAVVLHFATRIVALATKGRLASMHDGSNHVEAGGLVSYSSNEADLFKRAAVFADKILKGGEAGGAARRATKKIRAGHKSEDRQANRPNHSAACAGEGG